MSYASELTRVVVGYSSFYSWKTIDRATTAVEHPRFSIAMPEQPLLCTTVFFLMYIVVD
jgi:hypothetical protein